MRYSQELIKAMSLLAAHDKTLFIGQAVEYEGTGLYESVKHLPSEKRLELPVAEYLSKNGLYLPSGQALTSLQQKYVVNKIKKIIFKYL